MKYSNKQKLTYYRIERNTELADKYFDFGILSHLTIDCNHCNIDDRDLKIIKNDQKKYLSVPESDFFRAKIFLERYGFETGVNHVNNILFIIAFIKEYMRAASIYTTFENSTTTEQDILQELFRRASGNRTPEWNNFKKRVAIKLRLFIETEIKANTTKRNDLIGFILGECGLELKEDFAPRKGTLMKKHTFSYQRERRISRLFAPQKQASKNSKKNF